MIIIAGANQKNERFITLKTKPCGRCNNQSFWILEKAKHFVTLFFLPVVPYKTEYHFYCSICGNSQLLNKEEFEKEVNLNSRPYNMNESTNP